jgi:hypothetical protein
MTKDEMAKLPPEQLAARIFELEQENAEIAEGRSAAEGRAKTYSDRIATAEQAAAEAQDQARRDGNAAWVAGMAEGAEPRMLPAERPFAAYILDVLTAPAGTQVKAYSEKGKDKDGKDVEVEVSPADAFRKLYELRGKGVIKGLFTHQTLATDASQAGGDEPAAEYSTQDEARDLAVERAKAYAKQHGKDFGTALRAVLDADPELKEAYAGVRQEGEAAAAAGAAKYSRIVAAGKPQ